MVENIHWLTDPDLSPHIFWDKKQGGVDFRRDVDFVIRRVFAFGKWVDLAEVTAFYGRERVAASLISAPTLPEKVVYLASAIFKIPKENFQCYISKPSAMTY